MFTNPAFILAYLLMGVLFIVGYILINIDAIVKGELPRTASLCILVDAPLFGLGIFAPMVVRTIGLVLFAISLCWSGLVICKESISSKQKNLKVYRTTSRNLGLLVYFTDPRLIGRSEGSVCHEKNLACRAPYGNTTKLELFSRTPETR